MGTPCDDLEMPMSRWHMLILLIVLSCNLRLKVRKNNWDTETYQFDEVLTEVASEKRVYQVVVKPIVECS
ncbi:unnamed protein product [Microthlaspi erraticum]|uniref:Uncharacterized protein n=1 Tax=Microthlaspi erraticum TaxID=1685480 RepID=A0A6D2HEI8_9BRAS|nr:unnamed protein product [Microthlaspi erraticum]